MARPPRPDLPAAGDRSPGAQAIPRRKLYHDLLDRLQQRLREGEWAPGAALPSERELMAFYGVGRPTVREALQSLARAGIVEIAHGERARVVVPTADRLVAQIAGGAQHLLRQQPAMLEHLKEARLFLETGTARMAAERARQEDLARLRTRLREQRDALSAMDQFVSCDMAFHREIATISGNPIFPSIVEALFAWASEHQQSIVRAPGVERLTLAEHERIVEAIAAGDGPAAEQAMREHLSRADARYRSLQSV